MAHTSGPWTYDLGTGWIFGNALSVARVFERNPAMGFANAPFRAETDANARLIATSPELRRFAQLVAESENQFSARDNAEMLESFRKLARQIVAKADGAQ